MKKNILLIIVLLSLITDCKEYQLKHTPSKGSAYKYHVNIESIVKQNLLGQDMTLESNSNFVLNSKIIDVQGKLISVECCYDSVNIITSVGTIKTNSGSNDTSAMATMGNMGPLLRVLIAKPFKVILNEHYEIESITGFDSIKMIMYNYIDEDIFIKEQMIRTIEKQFGDNALGTFINNIAITYPDSPKKLNATWEFDTKAYGDYVMDVKGKMTLTAINDSTAVIDCRASTKAYFSDNTHEIGDMQTRNNLTGSQTGSININYHTGQLINSEIIQEMEGTLEIKKNQTDKFMEIPVNVRTKISVR